MMRFTQGLVVMGLSVALVGCSSDEPGAATPDAGGPGTPDAGPQQRTYPQGPYGLNMGDVMQDRKWMGYADTAADTDIDPFNEPPHEISLADYYTPNNPKSRVVVLIQSAGWCGPCQEEAAQLPGVSATWQPKGVTFITLMWQNPDQTPGTTDYSKEWGTMFHQDTPVVADPNDFAGVPFGNQGIPFLVMIDAKTMKIISFPDGPDNADVYQQYTH